METLITTGYQQQQAQMHEQHDSYGVACLQYVDTLISFIGVTQSADMLDYGSGKGRIAGPLISAGARGELPDGFELELYDPGIPLFSDLPAPADLVTCFDVLEHVEPELTDNVLDHIKSLARRHVFITIGLTPASKTLPDGRNAHINLRPVHDWIGRLNERFTLIEATNHDAHTLIFIGRARP